MSAFLSELDALHRQALHQADALRAEGRGDEATFERIRANIYDICRTVYAVCARTAEASAFQSAYLQKLDRLPQSWEASLALAREHGDDAKAFIEQLKLNTLASVRARYLETE